MIISPSKCIIGVDNVDFLGHQLQQGLIGLHEDNVAKIRDGPSQRTKRQIGSFMGLAGWPNVVDWGEAQERAYQTIKTHLTNKPILRLPDPKKTYLLRPDASDDGIGVVLMQEHDGKLFPICCACKKLCNAEQNYSTIEKECLAIVWAIRRFHMYL